MIDPNFRFRIVRLPAGPKVGLWRGAGANAGLKNHGGAQGGQHHFREHGRFGLRRRKITLPLFNIFPTSGIPAALELPVPAEGVNFEPALPPEGRGFAKRGDEGIGGGGYPRQIGMH